MASYNFPCSAPNCDFNTGDMPEAVTALALLQMHQTNNHVAAAATGSSVKPDKLTRPSITKGVNTEDWNFFIQRWDLYTDRCRLTGDDVVPQLLECCDTELTKDVYRTCDTCATGDTCATCDTCSATCDTCSATCDTCSATCDTCATRDTCATCDTRASCHPTCRLATTRTDNEIWTIG